MQIKNTDTGRIIEMTRERYERVYASRAHLQPVGEPEETAAAPTGEDLSEMTVAELRDLARELDVSYSGLPKADLIDAINEATA
jgi:hypothetical protein